MFFIRPETIGRFPRHPVVTEASFFLAVITFRLTRLVKNDVYGTTRCPGKRLCRTTKFVGSVTSVT